MSDIPPGLKRFQFSPEEASAFRFVFERVLLRFDLSATPESKDFFTRYKDAAGIYFWVMRYQSLEYKIYIGKTKSLVARVLNYTSNFQPHAANDHKLQLFQSFIVELIPGAELDLYFSRQHLPSLTKAETSANRTYRPLFFGLPAPSAEAKNALKKAFDSYYRAAFQGALAIG